MGTKMSMCPNLKFSFSNLLFLQGLNEEYGGASFTFGCSWSMYFDGCKYGKGGLSRDINKFRLAKEADAKEESVVAEAVHRLADDISPMYKKYAPESYRNMTGMCSGHIYRAYVWCWVRIR